LAQDILIILALILANGVFAGTEIAIISARRHNLEQLADQGRRAARVALRLAASPSRFLSSVQIGITLIGVLTGAVGGATIAYRLDAVLAQVALLAPYSEPLSFALVVAVITFLTVVLGELVPKRLALANPEELACAMAPLMAAISRIGAPLVHLLSSSTDALLALLGVASSGEPTISEEEIKAMISQGAATGVFEAAEHDMVQRVLRLDERTTRSLMTPRTAIRWLDLEDPLEHSLKQALASPHTRFPVGKGSLDQCLGVVSVRDLLAARLTGQPLDLGELARPPLYVAESTRALAVLEQFKGTGIHIALVTDEFGGVEGLVTLTNLMEGIVGDLPSAEERQSPAITPREDGSWLVDGGLDLDAFCELIGHDIFGIEERTSYQTLAGFVMHRLERVPREADRLEWQGYGFEVVDMDGKRVDKLLVQPLAGRRGSPQPR
jgi:Hemolysins and related proteins containing CBS domains